MDIEPLEILMMCIAAFSILTLTSLLVIVFA
jgi:hypothetical protein